MAMIVPNGKKSYVIRIYINNKQVKLYGFTNKEVAARFGANLERLKKSRKSCMDDDLKTWVTNLEKENPDFYDKIADFGLVKKRETPKTLGDLLEIHRKRATVIEETRVTWDNVYHNLLGYFSGEKLVTDISQEDAQKFDSWLRTTPLNRRSKEPKPYAEATANKRITIVKTIFNFAEELDWINRNPFRFLEPGDSTNPDKLEYVPKEKFMKVVEVSPLRWRLVWLFGRLCGLRGPSEMFRMEWGDIRFSTPEEKGSVSVRAKKTRRHGRLYRELPLPALLEKYLIRWKKRLPEGEKMVFPGMTTKTTFSMKIKRLIKKAGVDTWKNPWYNLRKSFCSDLLPVVKDITAYERMTDHKYATGVKHYQIMTRGRVVAGMDQALEALEIPLKHKKKPSSEQGLKSSSGHEKPSSEQGLKNGLVEDLNEASSSFSHNSVLSRRDSQVPEISGQTPKRKPSRGDAQKGNMRLMGLEPMTCGLKVSCSTD